MSMRSYAYTEWGFAVSRDELESLFYNIDRNKIQEYLEDDETEIEDIVEELLDNSDDFDFYLIGELESGSLTRQYVGDKTQIDLDNNTTYYIMYLNKIGVFDKYNNDKEMIDEIMTRLKENGFLRVNKTFVQNRIGMVNGIIWG